MPMESNRFPLEERLKNISVPEPQARCISPADSVKKLAHMPLGQYFYGFYGSLYDLERLLGLSEDDTSGMSYQDMALSVHRARQAGDLAPDQAGKAATLLAAPLAFRGGLRPEPAPDLRAPLAERVREADKRYMPIPCAGVSVDEFFAAIAELTDNTVWEYIYDYELFDLEPEEDTPTVAGFLERANRYVPEKKFNYYTQTAIDPFAALAAKEQKGSTK